MEIVNTLLLYLLLLVVVVLCAIIINKKEKKKIIEAATITPEVTENDISSNENCFFESVRYGKQSIRIASIYSYYDVMFLKSFLFSENIPFFFEFEYMNNIYGGIPMYGNVNVFLNVLEEHYEDVIVLLETFENQKKNIFQEKNTISNKMLGIILGWYVPISHLRTLAIYYQNRKENQ